MAGNMYLRSFGSDNHATVHPRIIQALSEVNLQQVPSYGTDHWSNELNNTFKREFGPQAESYLVFNGTAANVLALRSMVRNYQSVFCTDISHLFRDECGAPEVVAGVKLIPIPSSNGKLTVEALEKHWVRRGDQHFAQTQGISITQPTEVGTVYSLVELVELIQWSKLRKLKIHIDGARLANAAISLGTTFREFTTELGVDVVSFGGSKNGLMVGEAVVFCNPSLAEDFQYIRKQSLQLPSKSRFLAAQLLAYLNEGLWQELAGHSLAMAKDLSEQVKSIPGLKIQYPVDSNALFPSIPRAWIKPLREKYFFYVWDEKETVCRWMTSWDTTQDDVTGFVREINRISQQTVKDSLT
jgi:threonine aldolase